MPNYKNVTTGSIDANGGAVTHALKLVGPGQLSIQVAGTFVGTIDFEATVDGTNWAKLACRDSIQATATTLLTQVTAGKVVLQDAFALQAVRAIATAWTSGEAEITIASVSV